VFAIGLLRRFLYPILDPLAFVANTFYTHNLSNMAFSKAVLNMIQYGLFQNPGLHTCFGLNFNRGLNKNNVFASKQSFTQRPFSHKSCIHTNTMFHTKTMSLLRQDNSFHGGRNTPKAVNVEESGGFQF